MAQGGVTSRSARRSVEPWWEELDREAFREFPVGRRRSGRSGTSRSADGSSADGSLTNGDPNVAVAGRAGTPAADAEPTGEAGGLAILPETTGAQPPFSTGERAGTIPSAAHGTVKIRGQTAQRNLPDPVRRPTLRRHERPGFRPDRVAMWAVVLGLFLVLVAVVSAHAAVSSHELAAHALHAP
jgi:hypothetical protein